MSDRDVTIIPLEHDFSVRVKSTDDDFAMQYTVYAPRLYNTYILPVSEIVGAEDDLVREVIRRGLNNVVDAILDNPLVSAEVHRRYVAKEKVREILNTPRFYDTFDADHLLEEIRQVLEEKEDE